MACMSQFPLFSFSSLIYVSKWITALCGREGGRERDGVILFLHPWPLVTTSIRSVNLQAMTSHLPTGSFSPAMRASMYLLTSNSLRTLFIHKALKSILQCPVSYSISVWFLNMRRIMQQHFPTYKTNNEANLNWIYGSLYLYSCAGMFGLRT